MAGDAKKLPLTSVAVVLAAFLAGAGTGAGLHASFGGRRHPPGLHEGRGRLPPFLEALKLEPQQRTAIEAVVTKYHPRFEALFKENAPKMQALREELKAPYVPVVAGLLGDFLGPERPHCPLAPQVNEQLASLVVKAPHVGVVPAHGLGHIGDELHFDTPALREFGRRYAHIYLSLAPEWESF